MSLRDVLIDELRDLYSAENQLVKALPKIAKAASNPELKTIVTEHLQETKGQVERLKQVFEKLGKKATGQHCSAMEGLVEEGKEAIEKDEQGATKDVCLIGAALRVEHYEIAGYTAAIGIAKALGENEAATLLTQSLNEEVAAGKKVLAQSKPTMKESAAQGGKGGNADKKPKSAKEKESDRKSKADEAGAQSGMSNGKKSTM